MFHWIAIASFLFPIAGALIAIRGATIQVRANLNEFIGDLAKQGRWNSIAALVTAIGTVLVAVVAMHQG
jgi:hypothetical protein